MEEEKVEFIVYNSLTKHKEVFKPKVPRKVGMYVRGVTTYDFSHIGTARAFVAFDILYRYLRYLGYEVMYVRNFTDVDDKLQPLQIIKRATERGVDPIFLSSEFCQEFLIDMADLQCLPPTQQPRVSDHMKQIKDMISQTLQECQDVILSSSEGSVDKIVDPGGKTVRITNAAQESIGNLQTDVRKMSNDLHIFSLLNSSIPEALKLINSSSALLQKKQEEKPKQSVNQSLIELEKEVRNALDILGLLFDLTYSEVLRQLKNKALKRSGFGHDYIADKIKERTLARENKEFSRGDKIRGDLAAKGIALMDVGSETIWRPCIPVQQEQQCVQKLAKPCENTKKQQA